MTDHALCAYCAGPVDRRKGETLKVYNARRCCSVICARRLMPQGISDLPSPPPVKPKPAASEPDFSAHNLILKRSQPVYMPILSNNGSGIGSAAELCVSEHGARTTKGRGGNRSE